MLLVPWLAETATATVVIDGVTYRVPLVDADGHLQIDVVTSALPTGAATLAEQQTQTASLQLIDDLQAALGSVATDDLRVRLLLQYLEAPTGIATGQVTVSTPGTAVQFPAQACKGVSIAALPGNAGKVYLGTSTVDSATGRILQAGEVIYLVIDNLNRLWIDADNTGEGISFLAVT